MQAQRHRHAGQGTGGPRRDVWPSGVRRHASVPTPHVRIVRSRGAHVACAAAKGTVDAADRAHMRRALELAARASGQTHPNPAVGCVVVAADGSVVGEGYHPKAGMPHAEVYALRGAGAAAEGATAYVTLEPCAHFGRTPPCAHALVDAKVARVVVGIGDPNPLVASAGVAILQKAGIQVCQMDGLERDAAYELNADFMARMQAEAAGSS